MHENTVSHKNHIDNKDFHWIEPAFVIIVASIELWIWLLIKNEFIKEPNKRQKLCDKWAEYP